MKIGIFDPYLDTLSGGEKYILQLVLCLSKKHSVSIFWDKAWEDIIKKRAQEKFDFNLSQIEFTDNIFSPHVSFLKRFTQSKQYDAIIVLSDGSIPFIGCKLILHFQTPVEWVKGSIKSKIKIKRVHKVICNSFFTKHLIDKKFGIKSSVLYPPVIVRQMSNVKKENIILNVGRFGILTAGSSYKKQEMLVEVFKQLVKKGIQNYQMVFVVSYLTEKEKVRLEMLKKECDGFPIVFLENVSNNVLWEYYHKAKIYWHAAGFGQDLQKYPDRAEHFGIATAEAMGAKAVPVVINAGGQPEIITDNKNGFLWTTQEELLRKTVYLIQNEDIRKEFAQKAAERTKDFNQEKFCARVLDLV